MNSPLPLGNEFEAKGVVVCRVGLSVGMGIVPIAGGPPNGSAARRLYAELLLRRCLSKSWFSWGPLFAKKLALDAVMGVLGVLFTVRLGGGVTTRSSTSAEGAGKEDMRLLKGVPRGSRFKGGSLMGWRFFLAECGATGVLSVSDPAPTVRPRLCLIDPVLLFDRPPLIDSLPDVSVSRPSMLAMLPAGGADGAGVGIPDLNEAVEKVKLLRSGSFGDSYALGIAGTGGTSSSSSPPAELCTFRGFGVGKRELDSTGLARVGIPEPPIFKELRLELEESDIPDA